MNKRQMPFLSSKCKLHCSSRVIENNGWKIQIGSCIDHCKNGNITFYGINLKTGQPLHITQLDFTFNYLKEHILKLGINELRMSSLFLAGLRHKNVIPYESIMLIKEQTKFSIYLVQELVFGTSIQNIADTLGLSSNSLRKITREILDVLIFLEGYEITKGSLDKTNIILDKFGAIKLTNFTFVPYFQETITGESVDKVKNIQALGILLESLSSSIHDDTHMIDFIEKCKSEETLTATELLDHQYLTHDFIQKDRLSQCTASSRRSDDDFVFISDIGKGAYGKVSVVRHQLDRNIYALKKIPVSMSDLNEKMKREIYFLSKLDHKNVVRYYHSWLENRDNELESSDSSVCDGSSLLQPYRKKVTFNDSTSGGIVIDSDKQSLCTSFKRPCYTYNIFIQMEYCVNNTLKDAINENLHMRPQRVWRLFKEISEGLSYIHKQGIIHRDLKPGNIFLNKDDNVKIGDFGVAITSSLVHHRQNQNVPDLTITSSNHHTEYVGTTLYVAPELTNHNGKFKYSEKVDLYSLGVILYEMTFPPFQTEMERIETLKNIRLQLPRDMRYKAKYKRHTLVIRWLMKHDPCKRPTAQELLLSELISPIKLEPYLYNQMVRLISIDEKPLSPTECASNAIVKKRGHKVIQRFKNLFEPRERSKNKRCRRRRFNQLK